MSPSGGMVNNTFIDGFGAGAVTIGASLAPNYLFGGLEKRDLRLARNSLYNKAINKQFKPNRYFDSTETGARRYGKSVASAYKRVSKGIKQRYSGLRGGARALGWTYAALFAADIVSSMATPGLTASAMTEMSGDIQQGPLDGPQAYTQRQRALQAIFDSQMGVKNVIGQEASFFHK